MPLQGTFDVLDFSEVLRLLARQQLTGRLHVRSRSFAANLFIEEGALVGADQSEHQAAAATGDVRGRLEEICFEMLDAERGGFEFQPGRASSLPATTKLRVDTVLSRARKRLQEWQELQELIPSLDLQPRLVDDLASAQVTIDQERWRMLTVVDGRRSLRAIGRTLNMSDFDVCRVVKSLLEEGIVELDARAAALASAARDAIAPPVPSIDTSAVHEVVRVTDRPASNPGNGRSNGHAAGDTPLHAGTGGAAAPDAGPAGTDPSGTVAAPTPTDAPTAAMVAEPAATGPPADGPDPAGDSPSGAGPASPVVSGGEEPERAARSDAPSSSGDADPGTAGGTATAAAPGEEGGEDADDGSRTRRRRVVRIRSRTTREDG